MAYIRKKKVKGKTYYYLVEGVYEEGIKPMIPKQKVIKYLGNTDHILEVFNFWEENH